MSHRIALPNIQSTIFGLGVGMISLAPSAKYSCVRMCAWHNVDLCNNRATIARCEQVWADGSHMSSRLAQMHGNTENALIDRFLHYVRGEYIACNAWVELSRGLFVPMPFVLAEDLMDEFHDPIEFARCVAGARDLALEECRDLIACFARIASIPDVLIRTRISRAVRHLINYAPQHPALAARWTFCASDPQGILGVSWIVDQQNVDICEGIIEGSDPSIAPIIDHAISSSPLSVIEISAQSERGHEMTPRDIDRQCLSQYREGRAFPLALSYFDYMGNIIIL